MVEPVYTKRYTKTMEYHTKREENFKKLQEKVTKFQPFFSKRERLTNQLISSNVLKAINKKTQKTSAISVLLLTATIENGKEKVKNSLTQKGEMSYE